MPLALPVPASAQHWQSQWHTRPMVNLSLLVKIMRHCLMAVFTACCSAALLLVPSRGETAEKAVPPAWLEGLRGETRKRTGRQARRELPRPAATRIEAGGPVLADRGRRRRGIRGLRPRELRRRPGHPGRPVRPLRTAAGEARRAHGRDALRVPPADRPRPRPASCRWTKPSPATSRRPI